MNARIKRIIEQYNKHLKRELRVRNISLNDYIIVAGVCYKVLFPEGKGMFAGSKLRTCPIKNKNNPGNLKKWYESKKWRDSHPF